MLFLMRHGQAGNQSPDSARELTAMGRQDVLSVARQMLDENVVLDQIWHSPFVRAVQTAGEVAELFKVQSCCCKQENFCPGDSAQCAAQAIEEFFCENENRNLLIASHAPLLPSLLMELTGNISAGFSTSTCIGLTRIAPFQWQVECVWNPR